MPNYIPAQVFWFERTTQDQREVLRGLNALNNQLGLSVADIRDFMERLLMLQDGVDLEDTRMTPVIKQLYADLFGEAEADRVFAPYEQA